MYIHCISIICTIYTNPIPYTLTILNVDSQYYARPVYHQFLIKSVGGLTNTRVEPNSTRAST